MPLFVDVALERAFQRDGFVVFPFLAPPAVRRLRSLWEAHAPTRLAGIYSNVQDGDVRANAEISQAILHDFEEAGDGVFGDARLAAGTFLVKGTGPTSDSKLHQDYNNVDEDVAQSATLWVPLVEATEDNGALCVLRGSHRWFRTARGVTLPSVYVAIDDEVRDLAEVVAIPAGHAIAYSHALFHGSGPNWTTAMRPAAVTGLLPAGARHLHYWRPDGIEEGMVEELSIDGSFYLSGLRAMAEGSLPEGVTVSGRVVRRHRPLSRTEVLDAARAHLGR